MVCINGEKCSRNALGNMCGNLWVVFSAIFLTLLAECQCILNRPDVKDVTKDMNFNCSWFGGSESKVTCSCLSQDQEFYIQQNSIPTYGLSAINITNCGKIRFGPQSVSEMRNLRLIELTNIGQLILEDESLNWIGYIRSEDFISEPDPVIPSIKINIRGSNIQLSRFVFKGRINGIVIKDSVIEDMSPFAFSSLQQQQEVVFEGVEFKKIAPQALKKFTTDRMIIKNCTFHEIPSRAFYDLYVKHEFLLEDVKIGTLRPGGFSINNPFIFEIKNSQFDNLNGEGFKVVTRGKVLIKNNVFNNTGIGAFRAISVDTEETLIPQPMIFDGNIFRDIGKNSLAINRDHFSAEFKNIKLAEMCDCNKIERYFHSEENVNEFKCLLDNNIWVSIDDFKDKSCSILDTTAGTVVIAVGVSLIVLIILGGVLACWLKKLYRCGKYGPPQQNKTEKLSMIVPDGRTYRETELHVIVERTDLLTTNL